MKVLNSYELQDKGSVMKTIVRTKKEKVTWKEFFQVVMAIAFPIAIQNLLGTTASMVDTIMIGSQGELAVAAVGICSQISSLYFNCYWGFASGSVLFFSQYWGARDEEGINRTLGISLLFMSIVAVLFSTICIFFPEFMLGIYTDIRYTVSETCRIFLSYTGGDCDCQYADAFYGTNPSTTYRIGRSHYC